MTESDEQRKPPVLYPRCYIAHPISFPEGERQNNIRLAIEAALTLQAERIAAYVPGLNALDAEANVYPRVLPGSDGYEAILQCDLTWLSTAACVLRLPGASAGADREVAFARSRGIPIFETVEDVIAYLRLDKLDPRHPSRLAQARASASIRARHSRDHRAQHTHDRGGVQEPA